MMKIFLCVIIFTCTSFMVRGQNTYELLIVGDQDKILKSGVEGFNNNYIFSGDKEKKSSLRDSLYLGMLLNVDSTGNVTNKFEFEYEGRTRVYNHQLLKTSDSAFIFIYYTKIILDSTNHFHNKIVLQKIDEDFNQIWKKEYVWMEGHDFAYKLDADITKGDSIILIGNDRNSQPWGVFFYLFSPEGDSLDMNFVESSEYNDRPFEVWDVNCTNNPEFPFLVTGIWFIYQNNILIIDPELNIAQIHHFGNTGYMDICPWFSSKLFEKDIFISGWTCGSLLTPKYDLGVFSVDSNFQIKNHNYFGSANHDLPAFKKAIDFIDTSKIYVAGTENPSGYGIGYYSNNIILNQFNSDLKSTWIKFYGGDAYYQCDFILATNDFGCIISAIRFDYNQPLLKRDVILIKIDKYGMITQNNNKTFILD